MKKLVVALAIGVLAGSLFAMSKTPADANAPADAKACAVKAACPACTAAGGMCAVCKAKADATKAAGEIKAGSCPACAAAGDTCAACKAKADAKKAACGAEKAVKEAGCTGSVCPLTK